MLVNYNQPVKFINKILSKHQFDFNLNTNNQELKKIALEFNEVLRLNHLPEFNSHDFEIFRCYYNGDGHKGRCIIHDNKATILLFTEYFQKMVEMDETAYNSILRIYLETIAHELAHFLADRDNGFKEDDSDEYNKGHNERWRMYAKLFGIDYDYIKYQEDEEIKEIIKHTNYYITPAIINNNFNFHIKKLRLSLIDLISSYITHLKNIKVLENKDTLIYNHAIQFLTKSIKIEYIQKEKIIPLTFWDKIFRRSNKITNIPREIRFNINCSLDEDKFVIIITTSRNKIVFNQKFPFEKLSDYEWFDEAITKIKEEIYVYIDKLQLEVD